MGTRIRYKKDVDGYTSTQVFVTRDGRSVMAQLSENQMSGHILDATTSMPIGPTVTAGYSHLTKKLIKEQLEALGVEFGKETRDRLLEDNPGEPTPTE